MVLIGCAGLTFYSVVCIEAFDGSRLECGEVISADDANANALGLVKVYNFAESSQVRYYSNFICCITE